MKEGWRGWPLPQKKKKKRKRRDTQGEGHVRKAEFEAKYLK